jgi:hypothetical protein
MIGALIRWPFTEVVARGPGGTDIRELEEPIPMEAREHRDPRRAYPDLEQILFRPSFAEMGAAARRHPLADIPLTVISRAIPS